MYTEILLYLLRPLDSTAHFLRASVKSSTPPQAHVEVIQGLSRSSPGARFMEIRIRVFLVTRGSGGALGTQGLAFGAIRIQGLGVEALGDQSLGFKV